MQKIPTVFVRDPDDRKHVTEQVTPGCEWVLLGEGVATRKYDGTCTMFDGHDWWARREVKPTRPVPENFVEVARDDTTGKRVGWEPMSQSAFVRWFDEAVTAWADWKPGTYELCGPKINGNPEGYASHRLVSHAGAQTINMPPSCLTYGMIRRAVEDLAEYGYEGIVWHHPDGRMAKIKARDFT